YPKTGAIYPFREVPGKRCAGRSPGYRVPAPGAREIILLEPHALSVYAMVSRAPAGEAAAEGFYAGRSADSRTPAAGNSPPPRAFRQRADFSRRTGREICRYYLQLHGARQRHLSQQSWRAEAKDASSEVCADLHGL